MARALRTSLRIVNEAFVPDERKQEIRDRLRRLRGQVDGMERMLDANRPCIEILTQIASGQEALKGVGRLMMRNYLERCATEAIKSGRQEQVFDELMDVIFKLAR